MFQSLVNYLTASALLTLQQLGIVLVPILLLGFMLDHLSRFIRTRAARVLGLDAYIYFTAPGVMIHELGHAFFCLIFGHKIVRVQLFSPQRNGQLGSVEHAYNPKSIYQKVGNFFIGTGPIWFGTAIICLLAWFLLDSHARGAISGFTIPGSVSDFGSYLPQFVNVSRDVFVSLTRAAVVSTWQFWVCLWLIICIGSHITLSPPDIRGASSGLISLVTLVLLFNLATQWLAQDLSLRACREVMQSSLLFYAAIFFVICVNLALAVIMFLLSALRGRA